MRTLFSLILLFLCAGCIYIPTPKHGLRSDLRIDQQMFDGVTSGNTTLEEILLSFGEPTLEIKEKRTFAYLWQVKEGFVLGAGPYGMPAFVFPVPIFMANYEFEALLIKFDDEGVVTKFEKETFDTDLEWWGLTFQIREFIVSWSDEK